MPKVRIKIRRQKTSASYDILVEEGLMKRIPALLKKNPAGQKYAIICDQGSAKLRGKKLLADLKAKGLKADILTFEGGDRSKNLKTVEKLLHELAGRRFSRKDAVIALGGGVAGDIAGFTASVYMRGIPFIQVPTTLLAMADSSIGGKTGVNLADGKNLVGTFCQPRTVFIDTSTLKTLPPEEMVNGMSEIVKSAIIADRKFFDYLSDNANKFWHRNTNFLNKIIIQGCKIKASVVGKDEKENGRRMILNFGHTLGHALEKVSDYKIPHGRAVAVGMKVMNEICQKKSLVNKKDYSRIKKLISIYKLTDGFDTGLISKKKWKDLWSTMQSDKKNVNSTVRFVIVRQIGKATTYEKISKEDLFEALASYH